MQNVKRGTSRCDVEMTSERNENCVRIVSPHLDVHVPRLTLRASLCAAERPCCNVVLQLSACCPACTGAAASGPTAASAPPASGAPAVRTVSIARQGAPQQRIQGSGTNDPRVWDQ